MAQKSKIFKSNRALGYVSNHIPLALRYIRCRKENLVVTCVGRGFHTYSCSRFALLSVSGLHSGDITCIAADAYHVFTASDNKIYAWRRGTELKHTYTGHESPVHILVPFGPHLLSVDEKNILKLWDIKNEDLQLELTFDSSTFNITTMLHPSTYLNKILLGSEQGSMQLWNLRSSKQIYVFKGWSSAITVLEQAPAVDVVAVGLESGRIVLHNLKYDETVMEFMQDWGVVTNLTFRTDGHPIMISGTLSGHVVMWNLEERRVMTQLENAHSGAVTGLQCLPNEPLMVTSSPDNTLKMWIFDLSDGGARLLHLREGHGAPPTFVRFHGSNGHNLLSAGSDSSLRIFSTLTETFNKSLGKASFNRALSKKKKKIKILNDPLRMPPIVQFTSETTREKEWDNIAAVHLGLPMVTTWSYDKLKMGDLKLLPERFDPKKSDLKLKAVATCLCLTSCGNFVVIGYSTGHVDKFNIQSGIHRGSYGNPTAHKGPIRGVVTENLNQILVTGGSDAIIKFWHFKYPGTAMVKKLSVEESVSFFRFHHDSSMLAIALEDFTILLMDLDTRKVVRKFQGHRAQLTDITFSPDARWLISSAMDCTIRTWDVPSSQLIDCFQVAAACTSLSLSPTGDFLATIHVDYLGVFLWSNQTLYSHISLRQISDSAEFPLMELPTTQVQIEEDVVEDDPNFEDESGFKSVSQISPDLVTMSEIASSRWKNLLDIDIVKKRNKPKEPPKAPKAAPFFLPTLPSLTMKFDLSKEMGAGETSKLIVSSAFQSLSEFGKLLNETSESNNFQPAIDKLKMFGPSTIDFEVTSLAPEGGGSVAVMLQFLKMVEFMFKSNKNFELAQAYLGLFLKTHGTFIASESELREYLPILQDCQNASWSNLQNRLQYSLCVIQTIKGV
ncbi:WD repeat-containing protein 36 [Blattella germanica]|nr:WD repeat-containing protein 36 [Blattella germanica]